MRMVLILAVILVFGTVMALANANINLAQDNIAYDTVFVRSGDTLWSIASKRVTEKEDIRDVMMIIRTVNGLNNNAQIYPGQALKVPVK